jgi:hypothetical protein
MKTDVQTPTDARCQNLQRLESFLAVCLPAFTLKSP